MRKKLDEHLFMKKFKASLNNLSNDDDNFCKKVCSKESLSALKKNIYVKEMDKRNYLTNKHKFDDKLCLTVLSLMYPTILFYYYFPLDFNLFIYKLYYEKKQTVVIRTHIYENSINATNIFLIKNQTKHRKLGLFNA